EESMLAKISDGSLGRAIEMWESNFLAKRHESLVALTKSLRLSPEEVFEMVLEYTGKDRRREVEPRERGGSAVSDLLGIWKTWYRDLLVIKTTGLDNLLINSDFSAELKNNSKDFTINSLIDSFLLIDQAERDYMRTRNVDLMMENMVLKLRRYKSHRKTFNEEVFSNQ
ncbi:MAG: hypothetical protein PVG99_13205, partial [Desulfobacteraceae bacterium]